MTPVAGKSQKKKGFALILAHSDSSAERARQDSSERRFQQIQAGKLLLYTWTADLLIRCENAPPLKLLLN